MHKDEVGVDERLVRHLLSTQLPDVAALPLTKVEPWGTDNAVWRLGEELAVRLPRIHWANAQVELEAQWLPRLAPHLTVAVPKVMAIGEPDETYPWQWGLYQWLPGQPAGPSTVEDPMGFALELAEVVRQLGTIPIEGAPEASNRARPVQDYDTSARLVIDSVSDLIDTDAARAVWDAALAAPPHEGPPVWVQGDLEGNCLVRDGHLGGIVDWGSACVGDPAVDVQVVWSPLFTDESRRVFVQALNIDDATLARSRGAAIQQACAALGYYMKTYPLIVERSWHKLAAVGVAPRSDDLGPRRH
jgi:aminoglycoside phosphotransferase (APT) family kinase protein